MDNINQRISRNIRLAIRARGLTQAEIARRLEISKQTLDQRLAQGRWRIDDLDDLAAELDVPLSTLIEMDIDRQFPRRDQPGSESPCTPISAGHDIEIDLTGSDQSVLADG